MLPDFETCVTAREQRDPHWAGTLFVGDGLRFCVPHCARPVVGRERLTFFPSAAAALAVGLRPCERCGPLATARVPDWRIGRPAVVRGLRLIWSGFLRSNRVSALAARLGLNPAELRSQFMAELGATPTAVARAHHRQIDAQLKPAAHAGLLRFKLALREPYAANWVYEFLEKRALPGLEEVVDGSYRRRLGGKANGQWLAVRHAPGMLHIELPAAARAQRFDLLGRVARVFDVHADSAEVDRVLGVHDWLGDQVSGGIRVPGGWDGFETAVRAILGQQVSVARARKLAMDMMQRFGSDGFPTPQELVNADVSAIGMPGKRGAAVRGLAAAVLDGRLQLDSTGSAEQQFATLCALPGIGPWTAGYVAMRVAADPNAFPRGDWVVLKQMGMTAAAAERYSQAWAPWRAYALMYIWRASSDRKPRATPFAVS